MSKPGINSKAKGSNYELKIAKVLGRWWDEDFHRTPTSGGLKWKEDNRVAGDIVTPPESVWPWVTELKNRESWDFSHLLKGTGEIESYWDQVVEDSNRVKLRPLLIFHKNFSPNYFMIEENDFNTIMAHNGIVEDVPAPFNYFVVHKAGRPTRIICILEDFIGYVKKNDVIQALNL